MLILKPNSHIGYKLWCQTTLLTFPSSRNFLLEFSILQDRTITSMKWKFSNFSAATLQIHTVAYDVIE